MISTVLKNGFDDQPSENRDIGIGIPDQLRNGIWPRSLPIWMAAFYVSLFIIRPWERLFPSLKGIHFERVYFLLMLVILLFSGKKAQFRMTWQSIAVLFFLGAIGLSGLLGMDPSASWESFYQYFTIVTFYFVLLFVIRSPYDLAFIVICYIATVTVYLGKAQWEFFVHGSGLYTMEVTRLAGIEKTFGGPNALASSIVLSLPMLLYLWTVRKEVSLTWPQFYKKWFPRFLFIYSILAASSLMLTNSRSGMVSLAFFVLLLSFFHGQSIGKRIKGIIVGTLVLVVFWLILPMEQKDRLRTIWDPEAGPISAQRSAEGRIEGLKAGISMFKKSPITGVGIGNFIRYRVKYLDGVSLKAHSLFGELLGETGLIGLFAFSYLVLVCLVSCRRVRILAKDRSDPTIAVLAGLTLACRDVMLLLFFAGIFGHNLLRFNWLWIAAFSSLALNFAEKRIENLNLEKLKQ